jgi:tripartite-type tricarboxylate transporter receptor subunit TctC
VVENRPGGGFTIGLDLVAKAPPDGYTIGLGPVGAMAISPNMMAKLQYDIEKDFQPVALVTRGHMLLAVSPNLPVNSVAELIAYAKARPGQLSFGHGAPSRHVAGGLMANMAGIEALEVAYRGQPEATNECAAGRISYTIADLGEALVQAREGRVRALAVTTAKRSTLAPDIPALAETLPGYNLSVWFMLGGRAGLPDDVIARVNAALGQVLAEPALAQQLAVQGLEIRQLAPDALRAFMAAEAENWGNIIRRLNLQPS